MSHSPDSLSSPNSHNTHNSQQSCYLDQQSGYFGQQSSYFDQQSCYFDQQSSYSNPQSCYSNPQSCYSNQQSRHFNQQDPNNPFLAARPAQPQLTSSQRHHMDVSKLMQLQSAAAHGSTNMSSRSSSSNSTRTSSDMGTPVIQDKSCSRCQTTYGSFIAYSLNSYYCTRCAKMTGYTG
ncbi:hypothetical protein E6O75_ATG05790 [Venturia nashicola]|uniref:Uncharacterized protein n=1 Tax=Venturia nashicola TaxID=86259 RepID=A0A4Z1P0F8_9PEZI|nr:hypothetical protein E6O75_ATG05790 [Venturia nashicola]